MSIVKRTLLRGLVVVAAVGAVATTGCQTRIGGAAYPSPHYLQHYPVYFPDDPAFPLQRERDSMIDPTGELRRGNAAPAPAIGAAPVNPAAPVPAGR